MKRLYVVLSVSIIFFVLGSYVSSPLAVSAADSYDIDYIDSSLTLGEVTELFSGAEVFIPAAILFIGLVIYTYCIFRHVDLPLSFSSSDSFTDKLESLGQYAIDNATDAIGGFLYSVYSFFEDSTITSFSSVFKLSNVSKFWASIGAWIGGSMVSNISSIGHGIIDNFYNGLILNTLYSYDYASDFISVFNSYSGYSYSSTLGYFYVDTSSSSPYKTFYNFFDFSSTVFPDNFYILVYSVNSSIRLYFCSFDGTNFLNNVSLSYLYCSFQYGRSGSSSLGFNLSPNLSSYSASSFASRTSSSIVLGLGTGSASYYGFVNSDIANFLLTLPNVGIGVISSPMSGTLSLSDVSVVESIDLNLLSDTVVTTEDDSIILDVPALTEDLTSSVPIAWQDYIDSLVGDQTITLVNAIDASAVTNFNGSYNIPSLDNVWKYPKYLFDTLGSWLTFVGKCAQAVTVGDGGLSWLYYGGFIFLICGGIVGKILLG